MVLPIDSIREVKPVELRYKFANKNLLNLVCCMGLPKKLHDVLLPTVSHQNEENQNFLNILFQNLQKLSYCTFRLEGPEEDRIQIWIKKLQDILNFRNSPSFSYLK